MVNANNATCVDGYGTRRFGVPGSELAFVFYSEDLTDEDLSRLFSLQCLHRGSVARICARIGSDTEQSFQRLNDAGMVLFGDPENEDQPQVSITDDGKAVAIYAVSATREALRTVTRRGDVKP